MTSKAKYGSAAFRGSKSLVGTVSRLCYETRIYLEALDNHPTNFNKIEASSNKYRDRIHSIMRGEHKLSHQHNYRGVVASGLVEDELPSLVLQNLHRFPFEVSKEWITILSGMLTEIEQHLSDNLHIIVPYLISNYRDTQLSMICGQFFRDLISFPSHHERCLNLDILKALAEYAITDHFDISSDAYVSFKALIVCEKDYVATFLSDSYIEISALFYKMIDAGYFYKRQTLNLVYNIMKLSACRGFTMQYVRDIDNLKYVMNQLRDDSKHIQGEAFYLFYVIVDQILNLPAEKRPAATVKILSKNKDRLIDYFDNFQLDRGNV